MVCIVRLIALALTVAVCMLPAASAQDPGYCVNGEGRKTVTDNFAKCSGFTAYGLANCCFGCSMRNGSVTTSVCQSLYELDYGSCSTEAKAAIVASCPGNYYTYCFCRDGPNKTLVPDKFRGASSGATRSIQGIHVTWMRVVVAIVIALIALDTTNIF